MREVIYPNKKFGSIAVKVLKMNLHQSPEEFLKTPHFRTLQPQSLLETHVIGRICRNERTRTDFCGPQNGRHQRLFLPKCTLLPEKLLKDRPAVLLHHAPQNGGLVIESNIRCQVE